MQVNICKDTASTQALAVFDLIIAIIVFGVEFVGIIYCPGNHLWSRDHLKAPETFRYHKVIFSSSVSKKEVYTPILPV